MKNFRTILLITGILAAGLAYNTTFAQDSVMTIDEESTPSPKIKQAKDHKYKIKNEVRPMVKAHATQVRKERKQEMKQVRREVKATHKPRTRTEVKARVHRSPRPVVVPIPPKD